MVIRTEKKILMMKKALLFCFLIASCFQLKAQYVYGTTGLLHMPTADMQKDKTFLFGGSYLDIAATPSHFNYYTFNYYINITFLPWLEVGYTCTLHKAVHGNSYFPQYVWGKYCNQDRSFHGKLRIWKEGWWKEWTPQIVIGANDPGTNDRLGDPNKPDYGITATSNVGNGHWNRYYIAATKHFEFKNIGNLGVHAAYVYNKRLDYHLNGPCIGGNFRLNIPTENIWLKAVNGFNLMAEYDSRTINIGGSYSIWKDHINIIAEMTECKHFSGGIYFKIGL